MTEKIKTDKQRNSLHLWCYQLADVLNNKGLYFEFNTLIGKSTKKIPWTKDLVKEFIWKPILFALTEKRSTEQMSTVNPSDVYLAICGHLSSELGITCPRWPDRYWELIENE